ncbi:MAG TPA: hypothetical protein DDW52_08825 [Planctomycetaceae bacterium]|nr:hypothetical protein [Planctomycetaceae bacterium]
MPPLTKHIPAFALGALLVFNCNISCAADLAALAKLDDDNPAAAKLAEQLQSDPSTDLIGVLEAMKGTSEVAKNWYLSIAQSVADRDPESSRKRLSSFLPRLSEDPTARYWAFDFLSRNNTKLREEILESSLADPSLEMRYEAVQLQMDRLETAKDLAPKRKVERYQELLRAARLPAQVNAIAAKLKELDVEVDLLKHFGFVADWNICGFFDNVDGVGFKQAYAPESTYVSGQLNLDANYDGKSGPATWQKTSTDEPDGSIDLNPVFEKEKGAVAYAAGNFNAGSAAECEVRIGTPNACKVWINGKLTIAREVYHTGSQIDQYTAPVRLSEGNNSILVKLCQNEQTDPWAQEWTFQLRFTDASGAAIPSASE